jgi:hypothetical protein
LSTIVVDRKKYNPDNFALIQVLGIIINPSTNHQINFDAECLIDTGFYRGIFLPNKYLKEVKTIGVDPFETTLTLADGSESIGFVCGGYIQKIDTHSFTAPGKPVCIVIPKTQQIDTQMGELVGMEALLHFSVTFDGVNRAFTITEVCTALCGV